MKRFVTLKILLIPTVVAIALVAAGCSSVVPLRPYGNLGDSVNSPSDEFAPTLRPGVKALYFTSNRRITDDIWRSDGGDPVGTVPSLAGAEIDRSDISRLSQPTTNDGAVAFAGEGSGFFASGHAPDTLFGVDPNGFGGIVGGTDIFEFEPGNGTTLVKNLGAKINSVFWDSHPTVGMRAGDLLLIFSSDRPTPVGYSSPYSNTFALSSGGDTLHGNADLYYVFRVNGVWGEVRNFTQASGTEGVNSQENEYSPFLFCVGAHPRLFFSSNRNGDYDIMEAELDIDFDNERLTVATLAALPSGDEGINTTADEIFPYLSDYPLSGGASPAQYLFFSSNRDQKKRSVGDKVFRSAGGYDLYRMPLVRECRPPRIRYEVAIIDAEQPSRPVLAPVAKIYRLADRDEEIREQPDGAPLGGSTQNPAVFNLEFGSEYAVFAGSSYNEIRCEGNTPTIESYRYRKAVPGIPDVTRRTEYQMRDTLIGARHIIGADTLMVDTLTADELELESAPNVVIEAVRRSGDRLIVTRRVRWTADRYEGGRPGRYRAAVVVYDSVLHWDTLLVPTTDQLGPTERVKRLGHIGVPDTRADITIRDTVYVWPKFYQAPLCEWLYTRNAATEYKKDVPYFQTAFWEVNTTANYREHRRELSSRRYANAGFIELHPDNSYFGSTTGGKREARLRDYAEFAQVVDRNLDKMASEIIDQIIPEFLEFDKASPGSNNRLVIQIAAFSDVRPIQRGSYIGGPLVSYLAGGYDAATQGLHLYDVTVQPGASLVSASNDTLSKLRAFYGYQEVLQRLEKNSRWKKLVADGTIVLPWPNVSEGAYRSKMEKGKILIVMEGRNADQSEQPTVSGYTGHGRDFYILDDVRRIDVRVNRLEYINGRLVASPCCTPSGP